MCYNQSKIGHDIVCNVKINSKLVKGINGLINCSVFSKVYVSGGSLPNLSWILREMFAHFHVFFARVLAILANVEFLYNWK